MSIMTFLKRISTKSLLIIVLFPFVLHAEVGLTTQTLANDFDGKIFSGNQSSATETLEQPNKDLETPAAITEDRTGSKFSNKVLDLEHIGQITTMKVFGQNLFSNQCMTLPKMAFYNPNYLISPGDKISLSVWGAFEYAADPVVDSQGNIFIPKVGPVHIANTPNSELNDVITTALKKTFKSNVTAYANLLGAQPVQVFVSGYVAKPGLYDGMSSDSILYFLCKSGGVIQDQGSYRKVDLVRQGSVIASIDLYDFMLSGIIPFSQLHQGDSIVVRPKKTSVTVLGEVKTPAKYEPITDKGFKLKDLIGLAGVEPKSTYVLIEDDRGLTPKNTYIPLTDVSDQLIAGGVTVTLKSDQNIKEITVSVNGAILGPHQFIVPIGTTLSEIVDKLTFRSNANIDGLQLFRESVAQAQKDAIDSSLNYLEQQAYTKSSITKDGMAMQQQYAGLVSEFIKKAKGVKPVGQVVVGKESGWGHIVLQNADVINIPNENAVVTISGQVMSPMAINYNPDYSVQDYIKLIGGYSTSADKSSLLLIHEDGTAEKIDLGTFSSIFKPFAATIYPRPGDQVIVPNEGMSEALPIMATISQIVFQIAIAARVLVMP